MIKNISMEKKGKINFLLFILKVILKEKEYLIYNLFIEVNYLFGNDKIFIVFLIIFFILRKKEEI